MRADNFGERYRQSTRRAEHGQASSWPYHQYACKYTDGEVAGRFSRAHHCRGRRSQPRLLFEIAVTPRDDRAMRR